ncbi:hypothetical protein SAMN05421743_101319 [Thalassobacillus cyri]|uniref:Uncharacterized protein n=1 Tax=Thalassobacillus cyri TaxID=571932 RepID=A0A1H3W4X6_9BACI|nr:hypothetical protein SAMN05421743_101319 [Thalassobacillus cyri]
MTDLNDLFRGRVGLSGAEAITMDSLNELLEKNSTDLSI